MRTGLPSRPALPLVMIHYFHAYQSVHSVADYPDLSVKNGDIFIETIIQKPGIFLCVGIFFIASR